MKASLRSLTLVVSTVAGVVLAMAVAPPSASAAPLPPKILVGYADNLRADPVNFPTPWSGNAGVTFIGNTDQYDAGAVMLQNPNATAMSVSKVVVDLQRPGPTFDLWGAFSIPAHGKAILTQTVGENFDTSEYAITDCGTAADPAVSPPKVSVTIGGTTTDFVDSGHVLDTGGFDAACLNNESTQWTPIGSTPCPGAILTAKPATQALDPAATAKITAKFTNGCGTPLSS